MTSERAVPQTWSSQRVLKRLPRPRKGSCQKWGSGQRSAPRPLVLRPLLACYPRPWASMPQGRPALCGSSSHRICGCFGPTPAPGLPVSQAPPTRITPPTTWKLTMWFGLGWSEEEKTQPPHQHQFVPYDLSRQLPASTNVSTHPQTHTLTDTQTHTPTFPNPSPYIQYIKWWAMKEATGNRRESRSLNTVLCLILRCPGTPFIKTWAVIHIYRFEWNSHHALPNFLRNYNSAIIVR